MRKLGGCDLVGLVAGLAAMAPGTATAGAWIAPEGGQSIFTMTYRETETTRVAEGDLYLEYPVHRRWSLVAHPRFETGAASESGWRGDAEVGAKAAIAQGRNTVAALQAGALWRSEREGECGAAGGEVRALAGAGSGLGGGSGFVNAEAALRVYGGGCQRQRYELTAGYRPSDSWLALGQTSIEADRDGEAVVKAQTSIVRFFGGAGLQLGVRVRLDGEEREPALVLGLWDAVRP
ncbi:MAG: hypothetical protein JNJ73_14540 [Hyphomonadaceae bacterium]|nr:hypothetical protein [Hyphomonadaceae bacterium]